MSSVAKRIIEKSNQVSKPIVNPEDAEQRLLAIAKPVLDTLDESKKQQVELVLHQEAFRRVAVSASLSQQTNMPNEIYPEVTRSDEIPAGASRSPYSEFALQTLDLDKPDLSAVLYNIHSKKFKAALDSNPSFQGQDTDTIAQTLGGSSPEAVARYAQTNGFDVAALNEANAQASKDAALEFLYNTSLFRRVLARTGHPTRMTTKDYENTFDSLRDSMKGLEPIFSQDTSSPIPDSKIEHFNDALKNFADAQELPNQNLDIPKEIAANTAHSKKVYDAVSLLSANVAISLESIGVNPKKDPDVEKAFFAATGGMMQADTWIYDNDGKPTMRPQYFVAGLETQVRDINLQYIHELAQLSVSARGEFVGLDDAEGRPISFKDGNPKPIPSENLQQVRAGLRSEIWKRLDMIEDIYKLETGGEAHTRDTRKKYRENVWNFISEELPKREKNPDVVDEIKQVFLQRGFPGEVRETVESKGGTTTTIHNGEYKTAYNDRIDAADLSKEIGLRRNSLERARNEKDTSEEARLLQVIEEKEQLLIRAQENFASNFSQYNGVDVTKPGYESNQDFIASLDKLRNIDDVVFSPQADYYGAPTGLTKLDDLRIKASNFGNYAQKGEYRQSSNVYNITFEAVNDELKKDKIYDWLETIGIKPQSGTTFTSRELLDVLNHDKDYSPYYQSEHKEELNKIAPQIKTTIRNWAQANKLQADTNYARWQNTTGTELTTEERNLFRVNDTLQELNIVGKHSEGIPLLLIAECQAEGTNLEDALCLMQMMRNPERKPLDGPMVSPLVEYPKDIAAVANIVYRAFENPHFRAHHEEFSGFIGGRRPYSYDSEQLASSDSPLRRMTMQNLIDEIERKDTVLAEQMRTKINEHAEQMGTSTDAMLEKPVFSYIQMFAGSDAGKSSSSAIQFMTNQIGYKESQAELAVFGALVSKYMGCGSALHRNVMTDALIRTSQGLEMVIMPPEQLTSEASWVMGPYVAAAADAPVTFDTSVPQEILAVHNLGNRLNLKPANAEIQEKQLERSKERIAKYSEHYESKDNTRFYFTAMPQSLDALYSYAARPPKRVDEPWENDVEAVRTIGHNATQLISGFGNTHLYYGLSEYLGDNRTVAKERYLKDPDEQNVVNLAAWAITHSDIDSGWKFAGQGAGFSVPIKREIGEQGDVSIRFGNSRQSIAIQDIAQGNIDIHTIYPLLNEQKKASLDIHTLQGKLGDAVPPDQFEPMIEALSTSLNRKFDTKQEYLTTANEVIDQFKIKALGDEGTKALLNYVAEKETILGTLRTAARYDIEQTKAAEAVNGIFSSITGKKPNSAKEKASPEFMMEQLEILSPMIAKTYTRQRDELSQARETIYQAFKDGFAIKKPVTDKDRPEYNRVGMAMRTAKSMVGETPPTAYHLPGHAIQYAVEHSEYMQATKGKV